MTRYNSAWCRKDIFEHMRQASQALGIPLQEIAFTNRPKDSLVIGHVGSMRSGGFYLIRAAPVK